VAHLAAACGTKTLALFGPTDPAQWAPVGGSVTTLRPRSGRLTDLAVDEVVAAALGLRAYVRGE
jgi:heptosyltransferase-3